VRTKRLYLYYYLGKAYSGLNNTDLAVKNYTRVDSVYKVTKTITPEFVGGYSYLISYYKIKNNKVKQLEYLNTLLKIDSTFQKNYRELTVKIQNEYTIPNLVRDKENIISSLKSDKKISYWGIVGLIMLTIVSSLYGFYQSSLRKTYKRRFEKLVHNTTNQETSNNRVKANEVTVTQNKIRVIGIQEGAIIKTLEKMTKFEISKGYLSPNITLQSLSDIVCINNKYLSKIINEYKQKTFVQYINDLRIDEAVLCLQQDNDLKKYTINAIASEFGFNNAESFSSAFYKRTGLKPSFFIKELQK
jgi:AraC-like DNA-binding protein